MGQYVIKGASGYGSIPVSDFGEEAPSYSSVSLLGVDVDAGTATDPETLWKGHGAQIDCYASGGNQFTYHVTRMTGSSISGDVYDSSAADLTLNVYIGAYSYMSGSTKMLRVFYCVAYSEAEVIQRLEGQGLGTLNTLYQGPYDQAAATLFSYDEAWDDTPSTDANDPERIGPQGGEFADTEVYDLTNDIDIPAEADEVDFSSFISMYIINGSDLVRLGEAIFTTNTWTNLQNKFAGVGEPMNYIISAIEIPMTPGNDGSQNFNVGGEDVVNNGGNKVPIPVTWRRYRSLTFGSITLKETWGTEKDYSQTSVAIYLPYVGVKDLDPSIVVNSVITVKGAIDIANGDLFYAIHVSKANRPGVYVGSSGVMYRFQGNCGRQIPIGHVDNTNQLAAIFGGMVSMGVGIAGGASMPGGFNMSSDWSSGVQQPLITPNMQMAGGAAGIIGGAMMGPKVSMASGVGGSIGRCDVQYPYLIITRNVPVYPNNWRSHIGAPRYQTFDINQLHGFTKFADYHADDIEAANDEEKAMIEQAMKAGVFLP